MLFAQIAEISNATIALKDQIGSGIITLGPHYFFLFLCIVALIILVLILNPIIKSVVDARIEEKKQDRLHAEKIAEEERKSKERIAEEQRKLEFQNKQEKFRRDTEIVQLAKTLTATNEKLSNGLNDSIDTNIELKNILKEMKEELRFICDYMRKVS